MLCTVIGLCRYFDKDNKEKCALYVGYDRAQVSGQATRALMLDSSLVDRSIQPGDTVDVVVDFNGNVDSINFV